MKNIYYILVNFKKIPYEFYEWNKEDDVKKKKKIWLTQQQKESMFGQQQMQKM